MSKDLVSIIIVNWNGKKYLNDCLSSIHVNDYRNVEVIFVDNNSSDGSSEYVKKRFPKVKVIKLNDNYGFVGGNIRGVKESNGKYLLFLNNDTKADKKLISTLISKYKSDEKNIGILQPKIRILKHPKYLDGRGSFLTITGFLKHLGHKEKEEKQEVEEEVFSVKGACMLVSKQLYEKVGGFDKRYFAYFEETDLCWKILLLGKKNLYYPKALVYHAVGRTTSTLPLPFIEYNSFKNRIATLIKNLEVKSILVILPIHLLICLIVSFFYLITLKWRNAVSIYKAILWNLKNIRKTLEFRREIKNIRILSDKEIFENYKMPIDIINTLNVIKFYFFKRGKIN